MSQSSSINDVCRPEMNGSKIEYGFDLDYEPFHVTFEDEGNISHCYPRPLLLKAVLLLSFHYGRKCLGLSLPKDVIHFVKLVFEDLGGVIPATEVTCVQKPNNFL